MPSAIHNIVVELLEAHPETLTYLLELNGTPPAGPLVPTNDTHTSTVTLEARVDRAFVVGSPAAPESFLFAEVQLDPDEDKRFAWPLYVELARTRHRCEGGLVVLTFSPRVRRWIETAIAPPTGEHGSLRQLRPTVLALDAIPVAHLLRPTAPHLALLAVAAHRRAPEARAIAEQALDLAILHGEPRLAAEQIDAILTLVDRALRAHLEQRAMEHNPFRTELFRNIYEKGATEGEAKGEARGKAEGEAKGKAEGEAKGKAEGEAKGKAEGILALLAVRNIPVSDALRARILGCTDLGTIDLWFQRAATAPTAAAVVRSPSSRPAPTRSARSPRTKPTPKVAPSSTKSPSKTRSKPSPRRPRTTG